MANARNIGNRDKLIYPIDLEGNDGYTDIMQFTVIDNKPTKSKKAVKESGNSTKTEANGMSTTTKNIQYDNKLDAIKSTSIFMYCPNALQVNYERDWGEEELGVFASESLSEAASGILKGGAAKAAAAIGDLLTGGAAGKAAFKRSGYAVNPKLEMIFNGVQLRKFNFSFNFTPRSEKELNESLAIVEAFKYHSAPGLAADKSFFTYPSKFGIRIIRKDAGGADGTPILFDIKSCFCTGVEVDYSPNGVWATFKNGQPVNFKMNLSFVEDGVITKEDIRNGA